MTELPPYRDAGDDTGGGSGRGSTSSTPRWAKVLFGSIAIVFVLLIIVVHLTGVVGPGIR